MTTDEKILDKVQKLLAKAERTNHPEEAQAFTAKAQQLMLQHSIDEAMLAAAGKPTDRGEVGTSNIVIDFGPTQSPKMSLLSTVGAAFDCRVVFVKGYDRNRLSKKGRPTDIQTAMIFGYQADRDAVELIYTSLLLQSEMEYRGDAAQARMADDGRWITGPAKGGFALKWRNSFMNGYVQGVGYRFDQIRRATVRDAEASTPGVGLAIIDKGKAVDQALAARFPRTRSMTSSSGGLGGATGMGRDAAGRADLGQKRAGSGSKGALR